MFNDEFYYLKNTKT